MSEAINPTEIKTPRLVLRPATQETMDHVFQKLTKAEAMHFLGLTTSEEFEAEKAKYNAGFSMFNKKFLYHHLLDPKTMKVIGWCGYHTWYFAHNRAEIGYGIYEETYKNQGLMTEALAAILAFGFNEMNLNRIEAYVAEYNVASLKLLEKFKFLQEGVLRQHYMVDGVAEDSVLFSLLSEDYHRQTT